MRTLLPAAASDRRNLVRGLLPPLLILAIALFWGLAILRLRWAVVEQRSRVQQMELLLAARPKAVATLASLRREVGELQAAASQAAAAIPNRNPASDFLRQVHALATDGKIRVLELRPSEEKEKQLAGCRLAEVGLRGAGDYASLCRLLHRVESLDYLVEVTRLAIEAPQSSGAYPFDARFALYFDDNYNDTRKER